MANMEEFEIIILKESLKQACRKLYELGYCVNRGICKKHMPDCINCMREYFAEKSFKVRCKNEDY